MATSLAAQLQRFATPQTSALLESKKIVSILYDWKDAATKDRKTIYDIGIKGLEELISINPVFNEFKHTLFDESTIDFNRSTETSEVNDILNKNIKSFLLQLSPYFRRQSAQKCLEWLIRRYGINHYNISEMMALILPYHETMIFVKCVQTLRLLPEIREWYWIQSIQAPGVPLSKQTIISRAANHLNFLKFISDTTLDAVKELKSKAHNLQTLFAFNLTVTLGALDTTTKIESAVASIFSHLIKGLSSNIVDLSAASMSLIGFIATKVAIPKYLELIIKKLNFSQKDLLRKSVLMLVVIYETQSDSIETINGFLLAKIIDDPKILHVFRILYEEDEQVMSLCLPLISGCLKNIHNKVKTKANQKIAVSLLTELSLNNKDAEDVIRCFLKTLQQMSEAVVELDSDDDDDDDVTMENKEWYANVLRSMEVKYPDAFDAVKRDILSQKDEYNGHGKSLKHIFGSILCTAYNSDINGATIFTDLYHSSATNRIEAVKTLVNQLSSMPFSDDKKNLLVAGIVERLSDSNHNVVTEVLKFKTEDLIKIVGEQSLIKKLKVIIDGYITKEKWQKAVGSAFRHITSKLLLTENNEMEIFIAMWPYMFPYHYSMVKHTKTILQSDIGDRFTILKRLTRFKFKNDQTDLAEFNQFVGKQLDTFLGMSKVREIVEYVKVIPDEEMTNFKAFHIIKLLTQSLSKGIDHKLSSDVLEITSKYSARFGNKYVEIDDNFQFTHSTQALPVQMIVNCIQTIIEKTNFSTFIESNFIDFTCKNDELALIVKIYGILCNGLYLSSKKTNRLFNKLLLEFFRIVFPDRKMLLDFFSNFFINHYIDQLSGTPNCISIEPALQIRSMRLLNAILSTENDSSIEITMGTFIRIISGLTSPYPAIRLTTCDTLDRLSAIRITTCDTPDRFLDPLKEASQNSKNDELLKHRERLMEIVDGLLKHRERFVSNASELSSIIFFMKDHHFELFEYVRRPETTIILKAALMNMLGLVTKVEYLNMVVESALKILEEVDNTKKTILGPHESIVVHGTIQRFTQDAVSKISFHGNCKTFFEKVLQHSNVFLQLDNKLQSVTVVAMGSNLFKYFKDLSKNLKMFIIESVVKSATFSETAEVRSKAFKFFKKTIDLDETMDFNILTEMVKVRTVEVTQRKESKECFSQELTQTPAWKCGLTLLELLHKKRLHNPVHLLRQLFLILEKCLKFDDQSIVEYTKFLVLGNILNCCEYISAKDSVLESNFKIELVVECIRGTQNPQTHHHALQLLTKLASMMPEAVLHNMVDIFTFVGTSVVRRDDTYIYQLISNIIKSIVPILKENHVMQVLKAFSDAIMDVPTHRRSTLYEDLLKTLGPMQFLWKFLAILFEKHLKDSKQEPKLTQIAIEITNQFDCEIIIRSCCELIKFLRKQLRAVNEKGSEMDPNFKSIFNVELYSPNECAIYRNRIFHFISALTKESSEFSEKWSSLSEEMQIAHKNSFKNIIPAILDNIKAAAKLQQSDIGGNLSISYHILHHLLGLLYPDMLFQVFDALLSKDNEAEVRIKMLDLLHKKLESPESFDNCKTSLLSLLDPLMDIVKSINPSNPEKLMKKATPKQNATLQMDALVAIKLLSKILASDHPKKFAELLRLLSKILSFYETLPITSSVYLIECIGEVCANVRGDAISHLYMFMPRIMEVLDQLITRDVNLSYYERILTAIYRIVETLPLFLHPYLNKLITSLSILWSRLQSTPSNASQKSLLKLNQIWQKLSSSLELRVLIPIIEKHIYPTLLEEQKFKAVGPLMILLLDSFGRVTTADLIQNCNDLTTFFISVLEFRTKFHRHHHLQHYSTEKQRATAILHRKCEVVDVEEDFIIKTLVGLILKLSEAPFRQLYNKVYQWSIENDGTSFDRAVTFYRLSSKISESLKSLFTAFARDVVQNSANLLTKKFTKKEIEASSTTSVTLIYNILETLNNIFLYSNKFINSDRFNILLEPLVDLLDNESYLMAKNIKEILPKCLAQFAVAAVAGDVLWKPLIHQILIKTKSDSVIVRRCALLCSIEVIIKLGEDSTLLNDIIQPFSELLEDEDPEIKAICRKSVPEIAKVMNEDVQTFLS